jgi:hypothetical protein
MKQIMRLSERILNINTDFTASVYTHSYNVESSTEPSFTKEPSYTTSDKLEYEIKKLFPKNELYMFLKVLMLDPNFIADTIYYKPDYIDYAEHRIRPGELVTYTKYHKNTTMWLEVLSHQANIPVINYRHKYSFNFYKSKIMPHLKQKDYFYIRPSSDKNDYSDIIHLKTETLHSLETETYKSLKPNTYDFIGIPLIIDNIFGYSEYSAMKCHGRDSASIQWNSLYILMALHCLKKGGNVGIISYGSQSLILCQFISFVSSFFSEVIIKDHYLTGTFLTTDHINVLFIGYKGSTIEQKEILLKWYNSRKSDTYYSDLGVSCNPVLQDKLNQYSTLHEKHMKLYRTIADQYRDILDTCTPSEKESIQDYIIKQRHINYFLSYDLYLK